MTGDATRTGTTMTTWPDLLSLLLRGEDLPPEDTRWAMDRVMAGEATPVQVAGFLVALRAKGETVAELRALADGMLGVARRIEVDGPALDIVGTGGDRSNSVNISTMAAVVCAGAGVRVVKHGNRSASSTTGTADVLEHLGVVLGLTPEQVVAVAEQAGITFCFAQTFHPSMRHAAAVRKELGVPTAFNVLGPLTNPAQPRFSAIGAADPRVAPLMAGVFADRGAEALVFRGDDGLDELTTSTTSRLWWVVDGHVSEHVVDPARLGLAISPREALVGGEADYNADVARRTWAGERGPVRDAVVLNAGAALALAAADGAPVADVDAAIRAGIDRAEEAIDSGAATAQLERWVTVSSAIASS